MGVKCQILINKVESVFYAGETIKGIVKYNIDKPTAYQKVTLSLLGTGKYKWTASDTIDDISTHIGKEEIVKTNINILPHSFTLHGTYEHPFKFNLPEYIPTSYKSKSCTIKNRIQIKFHQMNTFRTKKKFHTEIPVIGFVVPDVEGPVLFGVDKTLFKPFSATNHCIKLKAELANTCLTPGENAQLSISINNDTDKRPRVKINLQSITLLKDKRNRTNKTEEEIKGCSVSTSEIRERSNANFTITLPTRAELYTIISNVMKKEFMIRVQILLPIPHKNAVVDVPVVISERRGAPSSVSDQLLWPALWQTMPEDLEKE